MTAAATKTAAKTETQTIAEKEIYLTTTEKSFLKQLLRLKKETLTNSIYFAELNGLISTKERFEKQLNMATEILAKL